MHPRVAQSALVRQPLRLRPFVVGSLTAHAVLIAAAVLFNLLRTDAPLKLDQKPIRATLVRQGKPRDKKMLPRKEQPPPPPPKAQAPAPPPPEPVAALPPKPAVKVPVPQAKPPPKQQGEPKGDTRAQARSALFSAFDQAAKPTDLDDLEGAEDGHLLGDAAVAEGERYHAMLQAQVHQHYDVSQTIPEQERIRLAAQVRVLIGRGGELLDVKLVKASGNELFDNAVLLAARRGAPFSPPPDHLRASLQRHGVVLSFTP